MSRFLMRMIILIPLGNFLNMFNVLYADDTVLQVALKMCALHCKPCILSVNGRETVVVELFTFCGCLFAGSVLVLGRVGLWFVI